MLRGRPRGGKKYGGRAKGTQNKKTEQQDKAIRAAGLTPLEYMLKVMGDETAPPQRRDEMARAAAPYCHARRAAEDSKGKVVTVISVYDPDK